LRDDERPTDCAKIALKNKGDIEGDEAIDDVNDNDVEDEFPNKLGQLSKQVWLLLNTE